MWPTQPGISAETELRRGLASQPAMLSCWHPKELEFSYRCHQNYWNPCEQVHCYSSASCRAGIPENMC